MVRAMEAELAALYIPALLAPLLSPECGQSTDGAGPGFSNGCTLWRIRRQARRNRLGGMRAESTHPSTCSADGHGQGEICVAQIRVGQFGAR